MQEILTVAESYRADAGAAAAGVPGLTLMENAGRGLARKILDRWPVRPTVVLCGPGNNGGDGFVAARYLAEAGWPLEVVLLGAKEKLKGDAAANATAWQGALTCLEGNEGGSTAEALIAEAGLAIDALFGAGLTRPLEGIARRLVEALNARQDLPVIAVDVPSGISGDSGAVLGDCAVQAAMTVTFCRRKPGHLLLPGRLHAGKVQVVDIGIPQDVLAEIAPQSYENGLPLWFDDLPQRHPLKHKYDYGHVLVVGGWPMSGAARQAARAAQRRGAGQVTLAGPPVALPVYALAGASLILASLEAGDDLGKLVEARRISTIVIGPGLGGGEAARGRVEAALATPCQVVLDAEGLSAFGDEPDRLFAAIARRGAAPTVLTPHDGEFRRLFPGLTGDRLTRGRAAAKRSGAVLLLKGADSVIAAPGGWAAINSNAPPGLATAGTGDVLAGFVAALLAQGMTTGRAAAAGAWFHGAAAAQVGPGLVAEDLPEALPKVLARIFA